MSPRPSASPRTLKHRRTSDVQVFAREDGLCEVEVQLVGVKTRYDHLTEPGQTPPTAVSQGYAGEAMDTKGHALGAPQSLRINRCHALSRDGDAIRVRYPRWYRQPEAKNSAHNPPVDAASGPR